MSIRLIVGLHNPGSRYESTRHNVGAWFIQSLLDLSESSLKSEKSLCSEVGLFKHYPECRLMLSHHFMNQSGLAVRHVTQFFRIQPEEILIVHDDLDLPAGRIKLKYDGGHGGHNGLRDIIAHLGTTAFHRLRIGIGHPGRKDLVHHYVLESPSKEDKQSIMDALGRAQQVLPQLFSGDISGAMTVLNS